MKLQAALDFDYRSTNRGQAEELSIFWTELAQALVGEARESLDIIEVGTPFVMEYGLAPVRKLKQAFPEKLILADLKIADAGYYEAAAAFKSGADIATVLAVTDDATIRNAMTAAYAQVNAAATESAAVQSAAGAKVAGQAAVTSAAIATTGTAATGAAVKTVGAATTSVTAIGTIKSAIWGLIGGWMGVAAAIAYATYKLFQYKRAQFNHEYYDDTVKYNGNTYKKVDGEWKLRGINDEEDEALGGGAYKYTDVTDEQTLQVLNDVEAARKAPKTRVNVSSGGGDGSGDSTAADLTAKLQEALNKVNAATATGSSGAGSSAAAAKAPEPKPVEVQVPIGQIAAQNAINAYNEAPGSQWLNPELTTDMNLSCAAFVGTMYAATGALKSFYTASGDNIEDQLEAKGAWHNPGDGYIPEAGDYISGPKHVGMYVGNGQVISRDSNGGLQQRDLASWKDTFGFIGFGSIREFTGGQTATQSMLPDQQKQQEAIDRLNNAKAKAMELFTSMKDAIGKETGTAYESGMTSVTEDVRKKAQEIAQIQKDGVPADAIKMLTDELATYQTTMMDKVEKQRKENLDKLVADTAKANAEVRGDYKSLADAEYQSTLDALDKERDERLKAVAKNKDERKLWPPSRSGTQPRRQPPPRSERTPTGSPLISRSNMPSRPTT